MTKQEEPVNPPHHLRAQLSPDSTAPPPEKAVKVMWWRFGTLASPLCFLGLPAGSCSKQWGLGGGQLGGLEGSGEGDSYKYIQCPPRKVQQGLKLTARPGISSVTKNLLHKQQCLGAPRGSPLCYGDLDAKGRHQRGSGSSPPKLGGV